MFGALRRLASLAPPALATAPRLPAQQQWRGIMKFRRRLGRGYSHRWAMMRNMVTSLIEHERIKTGLAKAKELVRLSDRMVTLAKQGDESAYRKACRIIKTKEMVTKLFTVFRARYEARQGGYTRVLKTYPRIGDGAEMAFVEMIDRPMKRQPWPLPEQPSSVYPGRGGRKWRGGRRDMGDEIGR